jgi:pantothenate kinase
MTPAAHRLPLSLETLAARAADLGRRSTRGILGIAGPPGSGKSTLAAALSQAVAVPVVVVPMDGFHLADRELARIGRSQRKGAIDTFDADGFRHLLQRIRAGDGSVVYAPEFDRERELAVAGAIAVPADVRLVITEGNYLLAGGPFEGVRQLLDECWYLEVDPQVRRHRLVERHSRYRSRAEAEAWTDGPDRDNALLVERTRDRADLVVVDRSSAG